MAQDVINWGLFIPSTIIFDVAKIQEVDVKSPEFKELLVRLYQTVNSILIATNLKDSGYYLTQEFVTSQLFFNASNDFNNLRPIYRMVVDFGALPDTAVKSVAHNITNLGTTWSLVRFDCCSTRPNTTAIHIPGFDPADITKPINIWFDPTNVNIQTTSNMSTYTTTWVIIEYILN